MSKENIKGSINSDTEEVETLIHDDDLKSSNSLNRNELMNMTGKELAKLAAPYSTLQLNSLERKSKSFLCDLILKKGDKEEKQKSTARAARTKSESESFIESAITILDTIKLNRDKEPLNAAAKEVFMKQAIAYADEKIKSDEMNINKANTAIFVISAGALLFDGIVGFKNSPTLLNKIKKRFFKKSQNDTK